MSDIAEPDISSLSYEQARAELVTTVNRLEAGNLPLEESLRLWERGEALADRCQNWLDGARDKLEKAKAAREDAAPE
ncbi:hypothetical protein GCM10022261_27030 [Brevibacterium daeguense]|uniref:Exodeoxyribonuclease 7 small subunit n=1 Tax=Brevibacterium daeguense TaxID=909936 RepID=A0ABP8EN18_9MICO